MHKAKEHELENMMGNTTEDSGEDFEEGDIVKIEIKDETGCRHRYGVHIGDGRIAHLTYDRHKETAKILCESKKRFQEHPRGGDRWPVTKVRLQDEEDGDKLQNCTENDDETTIRRAVSLITQVKGISMKDITQNNKSQAFATWCRFSTNEFFARDSGVLE